MKEVYSCNYKKNKECPKTRCQYIDGIEGCTNTTQWKYAKRIPSNFIKFFKNNKKFEMSAGIFHITPKTIKELGGTYDKRIRPSTNRKNT